MLVRHVAGVPTATEQRCVRCCEVIRVAALNRKSEWPGAMVMTGDDTAIGKPQDCAAVDLNTRETLPPLETNLL